MVGILRYFLKQVSQKITFYHEIAEKQNADLIRLLQTVFITPPNTVSNEPNEAVKTQNDGVDFSEQEPLDLPSDVKFEIEGGDANVPPGYTEKK